MAKKGSSFMTLYVIAIAAQSFFTVWYNLDNSRHKTLPFRTLTGDYATPLGNNCATNHHIGRGRAPLQSYIERSNGTGWAVWDKKSILNNDRGWDCNWGVYRPFLPIDVSQSNVVSRAMCLHPRNRDRYVSGQILDTGRWKDCDALTGLLRAKQQPGKPLVHVEIGANIGSCVMQVLMTTDATIFAFAPHPENLFYLTSTLLNLEPEYLDRVHLFPVALGDKSGQSEICINRKNAGNAQVQAIGRRLGGGNVEVIPVERLDDLLDPAEPVDLMKLDVQGYECLVLDGATRVFRNSIASMVFEVEADQLSRFGKACSPATLVQRVKDAGFDIHRLKIKGKDGGSPTDLPNFEEFSGRRAVDLVARRKVEN